jgi:biopolymer transport protein ExbD
VVINIDVDFDGTILWNAVPVAGEDDLQAKLRAAAVAVPQPEVHLRPNKLASYGVVAHVMADSQRLGVTNLGFVGNEQFVQ